MRSHWLVPAFHPIAILASWWVLTAPEAHAYLDAGTASMLFQILGASVFGALFFLKSFWWKIKALFRSLMGRSAGDSESEA